jgi:HYR domain
MKQNKSARLGMLWTFLLVLFSQIPALAGVIACEDDLNISPSTDCMARIDTGLLIKTTTCPGPFWIVVKELDGDTVAWGISSVWIDVSNYFDQYLILEVKDIASGVSCETNALIYDGQLPALACVNDTINCNESLLPINLNPVTVSDNCMIDTLYYADDTVGPVCNFVPAAFIARVDRTWTAVDAYGNNSTCTQQIFVRRPNISMVQLPPNITINCTASSLPANTGRPTMNGLPIGSDGLCNFNVTFTDVNTPPSACGNRTILRTWTVSDNCVIIDVKTGTQVILLKDTTPPVITCTDSIFYQTDPGVCNADIVLDQPVVTDNCSQTYISATIPGFPVVNNMVQNLPKGMHTVTFVAGDSCNNFSAACTSKLFVFDNESPTAICKELPVVGLPSNGPVNVPASIFDHGSYDNCPGSLVFTGRRGMSGLFAPTVQFTCADAGTTVMVTIKVARGNDPNSFNTCMVQVTVQDKLPPGISCPANQTIQCTANYSNLSIFGTPYVYDNCSFTLQSTATTNINNCGEGTIIRSFTATDPSGNTNTCSQTITVVNSTPYNGVGIVWPKDTMIVNYCGGPSIFDPEDLPAGYNHPITPTSACAMLAVNHTDQLFDISSPACYKLVRTWRIIDWCHYTPGVPNVGIWTKQQVIAVVDTKAPIITSCPTDIIVSVGADCGLAQAVLSPVTAIDCSQEITITNNSPFAIAGNNASGFYPQGIHNIVFKIEDGCGNKTQCGFTLTVTDLKPPTPYCNTGIITELQLMAGQIMAMVDAEQFNDNSFDNCTEQADLEYTIRFVGDPASPTDGLVLGCLDRGEFFVEVWVTDEAGNSDYCVTSVFVQDNMDLCDFMDDTLVVNGISVAGIVESMMGDEMPSVEVSAANTPMMDETDGSGFFQITGLQQGDDYSIAPQKDDGPLNGVTTFDLALMTSHVLGSHPFTSPYKLIAADVNRSGAVTTLDILELRKMILHIIDDFPNNTSWRFVPKSYVFPNPANPFSSPFPAALNLSDIGQPLSNADFVGIKIGDVNGNALPGLIGDETGERSNGLLTLLTEDRELAAGEEIVVPIKATSASELLAIQFTLEFETDDLELRGFEKGVLPSWSDEAFGKSLLGQGILTAAWFHPVPVDIEKDGALFSLRFMVKQPGRLSEMLSMTARYTEALAYPSDGEPKLPVLEFSNTDNAQTSAGFQLYQNQPNPFSERTTIGFTLPERGEATLTIFDTDGRVMKSVRSSYDKGYNQVAIERTELPTSGVLYYKLETAKGTAVRKMILL